LYDDDLDDVAKRLHADRSKLLRKSRGQSADGGAGVVEIG
jgi:hypothetical protein